MKWDEVIAQQEAKNRLKQLADEGRVPQALLFTGAAGVGKMALALAFASYLLGEDNASFTGNRVNAAAMLRNLEHPDLHFSFPTIKTPGMGSDHVPESDDFAKQWHELLRTGPYFTLEQWMSMMGAANQQAIITVRESDALLHKLSLKSSQGGYKVSIIWLPERMNIACANKMLKLLEEPPSQTVFLLVSEQPELLLETIRSRTQRFEVKRIPEQDICRELVSRRAIDEQAATRVAHIARGSWTAALGTLAAGNENRTFLDLFKELMRLCYKRDVLQLKRWSDAVSEFGREKQRRMLAYFMQMIRESFVYNFHKRELVYMTIEEEGFARNFAPFINERNIIGINHLLERAYRDIGQSANAPMVFFDVALKLIVLLLSK